MAEHRSKEIEGQYAHPPKLLDGGVMGGRVRRYRATIALAAQAADDTVTLVHSRSCESFAYGILTSDTSLGSAKIKIGTKISGAVYRDEATFTKKDTPVFFGEMSALLAAAPSTTDEVVLTVKEAALPAEGNLIVDLYYSAP